MWKSPPTEAIQTFRWNRRGCADVILAALFLVRDDRGQSSSPSESAVAGHEESRYRKLFFTLARFYTL
jgi:hypothetical protein